MIKLVTHKLELERLHQKDKLSKFVDSCRVSYTCVAEADLERSGLGG